MKANFKKVVRKKLEEYIKAGEHQDGKGFWKHFEKPEEAFEDFIRHFQFQVTKETH
jgi:chemotaxis methyl-accepting protein methylase